METKTPGTDAPTAQEPMSVPRPELGPRQMMVERQGVQAEPRTRRFPQVRAGICEFCGVLDPNVPSEHQYKLCPHYRGMQLRCSYCDASKNPDDIIGHSVMNVAEHPDKPGTMIVWCDSYECSRKHEARFKRA